MRLTARLYVDLLHDLWKVQLLKLNKTLAICDEKKATVIFVYVKHVLIQFSSVFDYQLLHL